MFRIYSLVTKPLPKFLCSTEGFVTQTWRNFSQAMAKKLSYSDLNDKLKSPSLILIDVREKGELKSDGKIDGSKNVPVGEVPAAFKMNDKDFQSKYGFAKPKPNDDIVVHCKAGVRAQNAAKVLMDSGYSNVNVYPGTNDWLENGGKLQK